MKGHVLGLFHVGLNPFFLRACYRNSKPCNLPLRFEHLREQMVSYKSPREKVYRKQT